MNTITRFTLPAVCLSLSGCIFAGRNVEHLANGYVEVTYTRGYIHPMYQFTLQHRTGRGWQHMVWPDNGAARIKGDVAIFNAWKAERPLRPSDGRWPMISRIFAVKAPEPPLDITSEVIRIWCKEVGKDVAEGLARATIVSIEEKGDSLEFRFAVFRGDNWPNRYVRLTWAQISEIMRDVKEDGVTRKDYRYGTKYIVKLAVPALKK